MNLDAIGPIIEKIIREVLTEKRYPYGNFSSFGVSNKKASGDLIDYISVITKNTPTTSTLELYMLYYAEIVDQGRKEGNFVPPMAIMEWIKNKNINVRDNKGRFVKGGQSFTKKLSASVNSQKPLQLAYAISRSIKDNGIRPTNFLELALQRIENNKKIESLLEDAAMQDLLDLIK